MAVTTPPAVALAASLKEDLNSPITTTAPTLKLLRALLGSDIRSNTESSSKAEFGIEIDVSSRTSTKTKAQHARVGKPRTASKVAIYTTPDVCPALLSTPQKLALATETFNKTLKTLSNAARSRHALHSVARQTPNPVASPSKLDRAKSNGPLRECSPNRQSKALPSKPSREKGHILEHLSEAEFVATAECAQTSLNCLRDLRKEDSKNQDLQLERGSLMLAGSLQALEIRELAVQELYTLWRQLDFRIAGSLNGSVNGRCNGSGPDCRSSGALPETIRFDNMPETADLCDLIVSFQRQVLKTCALLGSIAINQCMVNNLQLGSKHGPYATIVQGYKSNLLSSEKAAGHFQALSQILFTLCPMGRPAYPPAAGQGPTPKIVFDLQSKALEFRCSLWALDKSRIDLERNIWVPFRSIAARLYTDTAKPNANTFRHIQEVFHSLKSTLSSIVIGATGGGEFNVPISIAEWLAKMAQDCDSPADSMYLLQRPLQASNNLGNIQSTIYHCDIAAVRLQNVLDKPSAAFTAADEALALLRGPMKGSAREMEDMLLHGVRLRKAAVDTLSAISKSEALAPLVEIHVKLQLCCTRILFTFLSFVLRFIGPLPSMNSPDTYGGEHFLQKIRHAKSIAETTISNTLIIAKLFVDSSTPAWSETSIAIQDCITLASVLEEAEALIDRDGKHRSVSPTPLKVSNLYWSRYLRCRENGTAAKELLALLNSSTEVLQNRTGPERRLGFLAIKFERIAAHYSDAQRYVEAREALRHAISDQVTSKPFQDMVEHRTTVSLHRSWSDDRSTLFPLGRMLNSYAKLVGLSQEVTKLDDEFYDNDTLSTDERAAILSKQLAACFSSDSAKLRAASVSLLAQKTLATLSLSKYALQRVQLLSAILTYTSKHDNSHLESILREEMNDRRLCGLERDVQHMCPPNPCGFALMASLRLQLAFRTSQTLMQPLYDFLAAWSPLMADGEAWQVLENYLDDPDYITCQVRSLIDFADMRDLTQLKLNALLLQKRLLELRKQRDSTALVACLVQIAIQHIRLGNTIDASCTLASAEKCIAHLSPTPSLSLQYNLARADYLLNIHNLDKCFEALQAAQMHYEIMFPCESEQGKKHSSVMQTRYLCQSALLVSMCNYECGNLDDAVASAKQCVKLSAQLWTGIEKQFSLEQTSMCKNINESTLDSLVNEMSEMTIASSHSNGQTTLRGAAFWPYVRIHFEALLNVSTLSAHSGLFQDALYYAEQAQRIGKAVGSRVYESIANIVVSAHSLKGGLIDDIEERQWFIEPILVAEEINVSVVLSCTRLAEAGIAVGALSVASEAIEQAGEFLSTINVERKPFSSSTCRQKDVADRDEPTKAANPRSKRSRVAHTPAPIKSEVAKPGTARTRDKKGHAVDAKGDQEHKGRPSSIVQNLQTTLKVLKAHVCLKSGNGNEAMLLLTESAKYIRCDATLVQRHVIETSNTLSDALKALAADAVHCVLAETTVAFPSIQRSLQRPEKQVRNNAKTKVGTQGKARKPVPAVGQETAHDLASHSEDPPGNLRKVLNSLLEVSTSSSATCSTNVLRDVSTMLHQCFMLSSVLSRQQDSVPAHVALQGTVPASIAMVRGRSMIKTDLAFAEKSRLLGWPGPLSIGNPGLSKLEKPLSMQSEILDTLPQQWNIICIKLSEDNHELTISKLHVGQTPFTLQIPLRRSNSEEPDAEDFDFVYAKTELLDIVRNANLTAHESRNQSNSKMRKVWWAEREALDQRLKVLLENMENIWLGGFRGILSDQQRHQDILSRFSGSLNQSLNQHLPSRQKHKLESNNNIQLHAHVLDLFVALGHPEECELDDSINDLLYFVVDVLQFHGEHNAYDEIDFDMITVEVQDALRCYHEAVKMGDLKASQHTILVLDKELIAFPWESLSCLKGQAVTRMPSLGCIKKRLDRLRLQDPNASTLRISRNNGAYILNPSTDLTSTQAAFSDVFSTSLATFDSIINRCPTESEFESCLLNHELFLYFGHGSGAQYIRNRVIKRLDKCAVTFLMGCSSGKMTECGQFEPYGVPWDYMHANSPAVVGTLWDVTDKDIDRFAMKALGNWGLLNENAVEQSEMGKKQGKQVMLKGKGRKPPTKLALESLDARPAMELGEAVAKARDSCVLRYLNGAAPVTYGIPVVLD